MLQLDIVKQHCRIELDFLEDDQLISTYIGAAYQHVQQWTRRKLYSTPEDLEEAEDPDGLVLTDDVKAAMLLYIGHLYENREAVIVGSTPVKLPLAVDALLQPYRIYGL
ncbi:head-tail connector protein [Limnobaculum xujianqingii]|uniref:head-tail connector protein n=1 Tax=Limnobaculum xujianqingii TaxID=2738837 RepID=UPI001127D23D|nr:head-tail connector protein [Limnobaculum xujianqingii]